MARTPLARWFQRLFHDEQAAAMAQVSVRELQDSRRARRRAADVSLGASRRTFLSAAGALAGSAIVSAPRPAWAGRRDAKIAIVGGGIAGLTCALDLVDRGFSPRVFEAANRVGGRMFTNTTNWDGQVTEGGGELIDTGHETVRALAERFGLVIDDLLGAQPEGSTDTYYFFGQYYAAEQAERDFRAVYPLLRDDLRAAAYPTTFESSTEAGRALDAMSVYQYIESRVPGGHASPFGSLLDLAYAGEYGADTVDQSALNLLYLLAYQPDRRRGFSVFGESDEAGHIRGGNDQLPRAIAENLGPGVLQLGHRLLRVSRLSDGRCRLVFETPCGISEETFEHVVLAIPFAVLRTLDYSEAGFDELKQTAIRDLGAGVNSKLQLQFAARLWNTPGPWGLSNGSSYADTGYSSTWEATRAQPGDQGILVLYAGGTPSAQFRTQVPFGNQSLLSVREDAADALSRLAPVYPGLEYVSRATLTLPHLSESFRASYAYWRVGQYVAFAGYEAARQGNIYFAGEHTSLDYQGFMEGGASEGLRASKELRRRL